MLRDFCVVLEFRLGYGSVGFGSFCGIVVMIYVSFLRVNAYQSN